MDDIQVYTVISLNVKNLWHAQYIGMRYFMSGQSGAWYLQARLHNKTIQSIPRQLQKPTPIYYLLPLVVIELQCSAILRQFALSQ